MIDMIRSIITSVTEGVIKRFTGAGRPNETFTNREYFQHYGYTSRPLPDAEGIVLKKGNNIIMIASDDRRYRIALEEGEVSIYTDEGDFIHFKRDKLLHIKTGNKLLVDATNDVEVNTTRAKVNASESAEITTPVLKAIAATSAELTSPLTTITGNVTLAGNLIVSGTINGAGLATLTGDLAVTGNIAGGGTIIDAAGNTNNHTH